VWSVFHYCEVFAGRFSAAECQRIIALSQGQTALRSMMPGRNAGSIRDSDLFWVPRTEQTDWIFERVRDVVTQYNSRYGYTLSDDMGQLQLTRYAVNQLYNWHMDLGLGGAAMPQPARLVAPGRLLVLGSSGLGAFLPRVALSAS
jgi:hypothetical protein